MMKKLFGSIILVIIVLVVCIVGHGSSRVHALSNNDLIDDVIFDNSSSMSAAQIDNWLNGFPNSCISPNSGFKAADPVGYSPFYPYLDGKYSYGAPVTAGQVIYDAAAAHHINPQVLLTKLQNEEQLVDGSAGCDNWRYTSATGYACTDGGTNSHNYTYTGADPYASGAVGNYTLNDQTDLVTPLYYMNGVAVNSITGSCVNANVKAGFSEQVVHAAWALAVWRHKAEGQTSWASVSGNWNHCEDNDTCAASYNVPAGWACYSGFMTQGNFKTCPTDTQTTYYDGYAPIDGQSIHMDTGATAALYVYTPHIQSFATIFDNWFGSSLYHGIPYAHPDGTLVRDQNALQVYQIENGQRLPVQAQESVFSYGYNFGDVKFANYYDDQLPVGTPLPILKEGTIFKGSGPAIYVYRVVSGVPQKQHFPTWEIFTGLGYTMNDVMTVPDWELPSANYATDVTATQHPVGALIQPAGSPQVYYLDPNGTKRQFISEESFYSYRNSFHQLKRATTADLQLIDGNPMGFREGTLLKGSGPQIYVANIQASGGSQQKSFISSWFCFVQMGYVYPNDVMTVPDWELNAMPQQGPAC